MSGETILVVDDEPDIREILKDILEDEDYRVITAAGAEAAREEREQQRVDLVLLDIWMPGTDGMALLREWANGGGPSVPVVMISGHGNVETAVEAIRVGAYDFIEKPVSTAKLLVTVERALQNDRLRRENARLRTQLEPAHELVGSGPTMSALRQRLGRIAESDSWVLITGEPGSGKGVAARHLHGRSRRAEQPFVDVSLAAVPPENVAVDLFGAEGGSQARFGRFEQASGGTLLLDEIADMDLSTQAKLLHALQDGRFLRVGGRQYVDMDVRIIATTNQDLGAAVAEGRFREDLYYRLNVVPVTIPPLREHREDIPELVRFFVSWMSERERLPARTFDAGALEELRRHPWPGNVRELKNLVQRLLILNHGHKVTAAEISEALGARAAEPAAFPESVFDASLRDARERFERSYLEHHLRETGGNVADLAQIAGMERTHLYRKLKALDVLPRKKAPEN